MLPQSFTERMQGLLGSEYEEFLASFEHEKYQALRLNPLKKDDMHVITEKVKQTFSVAAGFLGGERILLYQRGPAGKASLA